MHDSPDVNLVNVSNFPPNTHYTSFMMTILYNLLKPAIFSIRWREHLTYRCWWRWRCPFSDNYYSRVTTLELRCMFPTLFFSHLFTVSSFFVLTIQHPLFPPFTDWYLLFLFLRHFRPYNAFSHRRWILSLFFGFTFLMFPYHPFFPWYGSRWSLIDQYFSSCSSRYLLLYLSYLFLCFFPTRSWCLSVITSIWHQELIGKLSRHFISWQKHKV